MPIAAATTWYSNVAGAASNVTTETQPQMTVRPAGTFTNLLSIVSANTFNGTTTVRLRKNAVNANNILSIATTLTGTFEDTTSSDSFTDGQLLSLSQITPAGSGTITFRYHSLIFDANTNTRTQCSINGTASIATASTTRYTTLTGQRDAATMAITTESLVQTLFKSACTLKNLYINVTANARTATTLRTRKNAANGAQSVSITASTTGRFEDTTNTDTIAVNDLVNYSLTTGTGSQTLTFYNIAVGIESTTNTTYLIAGQAVAATVNFGETNFSPFGNLLLQTNAALAESNTLLTSRLGYTAIAANLTFRNSVNSVNGTSTFKLRKNSADTSLSCSIGSSATGSFSDTSNTVSVATTDTINYALVTGGSSGTLTYRTANADLSLLTSIEKSLTLKFTILESLTAITKQLTLKLNIQQEITKTNTLKFSIIQEITKTLNTKFSIVTSITKQLTVKLNILQEITKQLTTKLSIQQEITKILNTKFSILTSITKQLTTKLSILQEIIKQLTTRLDIIGRITETQTHKYNIIGRITTTKTHKYNVLVAITATKNHLYNVIGKVTRLRTHKYNVIQAITKTNTHKYDIIGKITRLRTHKYNIIEQIEANKTHKYNVTAPEGTVSRTRTHKYNVDGRVTTTKTHIYNVLDSIALSATHKYHVLNQALATKTHKYNIIGRLYTTKTHKYNVIRQITATKNHLYDILEGLSEVSKNTTHIYNVLVRITNTLTHKYNIIGKATRLRTHKYNITGRIYKNGTYKFNIIQKITQIRTHKYNLLNRVTPDRTRTHKYNVLGKITRLRTHKYNIIGRIYRTRTHKYHMGGKLVVNRIHKYNVGSALGLQELGGSTNAFIRFPERVRIIDIVSNIENVVVANIEIIVSRPPANKAIGLVVIAEYSSRLLTASAYKPRHRIASKQIIPPIIDTIDNVAVAPHIAIEILEPTQQSKLRLLAHIEIPKLLFSNLQTQGLTQLKQDNKSKIKIASAIMLEQTQQTQIKSESNIVIEGTLFNRAHILAPEIMTKQRAKTLKTLINLLSSDHLFE